MKKGRIIAVALLALITVGCMFWANHQTSAGKEAAGTRLKELPPPEITGGTRGELGIDKHINESTIDDYLFREDAVYRDMRMLKDPGNYEAIGGDRFLSGYVEGFEVVPLPFIIPVKGLPSEVGNTYTGTTLFHEEHGRYVANFNEAMETLEQIFPKDKVIFLMCGGGGYAGMTKHFLVSMGWDENKIYNVGGYWYYQGEHNVQVKNEVDGEITYDFDSVPYHSINFGKMTKSVNFREPTIPATEVKINAQQMELWEGTSFRLDAIVLPNEAHDREVTWTSSDESVARVDETGVVRAVGTGEATVTASTQDGVRSASCAVTVRERVAGDSIVLDDLSEEAATFAALNLGKLHREFSDIVDNPDGSMKEEYSNPDGSANDLWRAEYEKLEERTQEAQRLRSEIFGRLLEDKNTFIVLIRSKECEARPYSVIDGAVKLLDERHVIYFEVGTPFSDGDGTLMDSNVGRTILESNGSVAIVKDGALYTHIDPDVDAIKSDEELLNWFEKYIDVN